VLVSVEASAAFAVVVGHVYDLQEYLVHGCVRATFLVSVICQRSR
jgi:hypothetical protein